MSDQAESPKPTSEITEVEQASTASSHSLESNSKKTNRVYISNVDYGTTEDDLALFFQDYNVKSVIVPSHTLRALKGRQLRPLGIAYAEFEDHESALKVIEELNGKKLDGRELRIKIYVPYSPKKRYLKKKNSAEPETKKTEVAAEAASEQGSTNGAQTEEIKEDSSPKVSKDTIFVGKLPPKTTDTDLRAFFAEYDPFDIYLFRGRYAHRPFRFASRHVSALVTVLAENGQQNAIKDLSNKKLNGRYIKLRPAFVYKIEEVKSAVQKRQAEKQGDEEIANEQVSDSQQTDGSAEEDGGNETTEDAADETEIITKERVIEA